jgi:hypothetical protein
MTQGRHLRFQALGAVTLVVGLLPWPFSASLADPVQLAGAYFAWAAAMYLFAAGGTLVAAFTFSSGEPMRPAWLLLSASYLVLVPAGIAVGPRTLGLYEAVNRSPLLTITGSIVSGALAVAAFVLLSRAWRASGLDLTSRANRVVARLVGLAVALALAGPDLWERFPAAANGDALAMGDVVTDVLDGTLFVVAVPVLRAALLLGGGLAAWPWLFLTASLGSWLGYDAVAVFGEAAGLDGRTIRVTEEVCRTLGAAFAFSAGVGQRWVMTARAPATSGRGDRAAGGA